LSPIVANSLTPYDLGYTFNFGNNTWEIDKNEINDYLNYGNWPLALSGTTGDAEISESFTPPVKTVTIASAGCFQSGVDQTYCYPYPFYRQPAMSHTSGCGAYVLKTTTASRWCGCGSAAAAQGASISSRLANDGRALNEGAVAGLAGHHSRHRAGEQQQQDQN
jgi:hypothetical protein